MSIITSNKIKSSNITVFPSGFRGQGYNKSKFTTEDNLTTFAQISSNLNNNNQVFRDPYDASNIIIYIKGYYFNVKEENIPTDGSNPVYAFIRLCKKGDNVGYVLSNAYSSKTDSKDSSVRYTLDATEGSDDVFYGLSFCTAISDLSTLEVDAGDDCYYYVQVRNSNGQLVFQNLKLDTYYIKILLFLQQIT